ncbi:MAG TPA: RNA polymerase sigma factor [bacterium]|nr:RNA polymerase sigma factor [bacterium]
MDEAAAIRLCLKYRDPAGFEFLVNQYKREAFFHAVTLLGNPEDAADACQESFSRAFSAMPRLSHLDRFYPWFYRILRNCCLNLLARRQTARKYRIENAHKDHADVSGCPQTILEKEEDRKRIWEVLQGLNPEFREILVMKYIRDCRYEQIAEVLDIPRGTVMSRLYYARKAFRDAYTAHGEERKEGVTI